MLSRKRAFRRANALSGASRMVSRMVSRSVSHGLGFFGPDQAAVGQADAAPKWLDWTQSWSPRQREPWAQAGWPVVPIHVSMSGARFCRGARAVPPSCV